MAGWFGLVLLHWAIDRAVLTADVNNRISLYLPAAGVLSPVNLSCGGGGHWKVGDDILANIRGASFVGETGTVRLDSRRRKIGSRETALLPQVSINSVSYTHLTLPTNREV